MNTRNRDDQSTQVKGDLIPLDDAIKKLAALRDSRALKNAIECVSLGFLPEAIKCCIVHWRNIARAALPHTHSLCW